MLLASIAFGCEADQTCTVSGAIQGNFSGTIAWTTTGKHDCELRDDGLRVEYGEDALTISQEPLATTEFAWVVGQYVNMGVTFQSGSRSWTAEQCQVNVTSVTREDWTKSDYLYISGAIACPTLTSYELPPLDLVGVTFAGYVIEDPYY